MRSWLTGLVVLVAALGAGCATFKPQTCPASGGYPWFEVTTPHFQILSDLDPPELRAAAARMEREREALVQVLKWDPDIRSLVVHFRSEPELKLIGLQSYLGFTQPGAGALHVGEVPVLVTVEPSPLAGTDGLTSVVAHEVAHQLHQSALHRMPRWLAEGVASYLETVKITGRTAIIGQPPWALYQVARVQQLSLDQLFTWSERPKDLDKLYASSWIWAHFLWNQHPAELQEVFRRLGNSEEPRKAWAGAFGRFTDQALAKELSTYSFQVFPTREVPITYSGGEMEVKPLSDARLHAMLASLWIANPDSISDQDRVVETTRHLNEALRQDPSNADARILQLELAEGDEAKSLEATLARDLPDRPQAWVAVGQSAQDRKDAEASRAAFQKALELKPGHPIAANALAWMLLQENKPREALPLAEKAVAGAPWSASILDTLAMAYAGVGRCKEARTSELRAIELLSDLAAERLRKLFIERLTSIDTGCLENRGWIAPPSFE